MERFIGTIAVIGVVVAINFFSGSKDRGEVVEDFQEKLQELSWSPYTDPKGEFKVDFASAPEVTHEDDNRYFESDAGNAGDFSVYELHFDEFNRTEEAIDFIKRTATKSDPETGTVLNSTETPFSKNGQSGVDLKIRMRGYYTEETIMDGRVTATTPAESYRYVRIIGVDESMLYIIEVNTLGDEQSTANRFIDSFKRLKPMD